MIRAAEKGLIEACKSIELGSVGRKGAHLEAKIERDDAKRLSNTAVRSALRPARPLQNAYVCKVRRPMPLPARPCCDGSGPKWGLRAI